MADKKRNNFQDNFDISNSNNFNNSNSELDQNILYIQNLQEINKNLRSQLDHIFKLIKMKLKFDCNERLDSILDELEILKTSLSFAMQKQSNIVSNQF